MEALKLYWLGSPIIELNGRPVKLETRKATALLAYLSLRPGKCPREFLATMFWPEVNQQKALANLRRTLSSLNASLPGWIEADRETITLKRNLKLGVDVEAFQASLLQLQKYDHATTEIHAACLPVLGNTLELYRGNFLEGLNLNDCPNFDEWQFFQRDGLRQAYGSVLQRISYEHSQLGQWNQAIPYARRWLALDRLHEPAWRALIDLYTRSGQRSAALHQYAELARLLKEQLGQEPEPETRRLYEQIRGREEAKQAMEATERPSSFPLLKTKLYIPTAPASRVVRSHLVAQLEEVQTKALTLISAPAGFGKTTLLAEWIAQTSLPVAWLSLDNGDNDPYRFLSYLIAALESIQEDVGAESRQIMQSLHLVEPHVVLAALINDLGKIPEPFALILDDYQFITEPAVQATTSYLLDHAPSSLHIVIATRADPPLQLGRLRAHGQMLELRTHDLCFHSEETTAFLNNVMGLGLSPTDIAILDARTEGWVVGLQMAALSLKGQENVSGFIQAFSGSHRYILDYLLEEVLRQQPAHIQTFLLETSILEKLNGPLCEALMTEQWRQSGESGQSVLEYLERNNLFLISMDEERTWFRFHHLFADLLQSRFKQNDPEREKACHQQAARWFAENSYRVEAVDHAMAARDFPSAADFIEKYALRLLARNEIMTITRWIKSLPQEVIHNRPRLLIYHALVLARTGDAHNLEPMLQQAESMLCVAPPSHDLEDLRNYIKQLRAYTANIQSDGDLAIRIALGAEEQSLRAAKSSTDTKYLLGFELAYAYYSKGDLEVVEKILRSMAKSAEMAEDIYNLIVARTELANVQLLRGNMIRAEKIYDRTQEWLSQKLEKPAIFQGVLEVCRASILLERNELKEADRMVREGIGKSLHGSLTNTVAHGYIILANILRAQGDIHLARDAVEKAAVQVQEHRTYPRLVRNVKICQVDQWLAEGNLTAAQTWARDEFQAPYDPVPFYRESEHIALARVMLASGQFAEASGLLEKMAEAAESGGREGRLIKINVLRALVCNGLRRGKEALHILESSLVKARPEGYFRIFLDEGAQLESLLRNGKQQGLWQEPALSGYIDRLLDSFRES